MPESATELCLACMGSGEIWTECCSGYRCDCRGDQIWLGSCQVCGGYGYVPEGTKDFSGNIEYVKAHISASGYVGNPYGVRR